MSSHAKTALGFQLEDWRIRGHLSRVERLLRRREVSTLSPKLRARRSSNLDHLRNYWMKGEFPRNDGRRFLYAPCFIDGYGRKCAVADLIVQSSNVELAQSINQMHHNARVRQMDTPELKIWVNQSGLTVDELALIQPGYGAPGFILWYCIIFGPVLFVLSILNIVFHMQNLSFMRPNRKRWFVSLMAVGGFLTSVGIFLVSGFLALRSFIDTDFIEGDGDRIIVWLVLVPIFCFLWWVNYRGFLSSIRVLSNSTVRDVKDSSDLKDSWD